MATEFYRSIHGQPDAVQQLLTDWNNPEEVAKKITHIQRLFLVGLGTSLHSALIGPYLFRLVNVDAWAVPPVEFVNYPRVLQKNEAVFVLSATGDNHPWSNLAIQQTMGTNTLTIGVTSKQSRMLEADMMLRTVELDLPCWLCQLPGCSYTTRSSCEQTSNTPWKRERSTTDREKFDPLARIDDRDIRS